MRFRVVLLVWVVSVTSAVAQQGFRLDPNLRRVTIDFRLVNNLIFIPVEVNGVKLNFMLDSGVDETLLFSLDQNEEVAFQNVEKVMLRGLGSDEPVEGLKSRGNTLRMAGLRDDNHEIYIILGQDFDLSSSIGLAVNGIIGYRFFADNTVEIDYERKKLHVYKALSGLGKRIRRFTEVDMTLENHKPFVMIDVATAQGIFKSKLLVDSGNSDALWLFSDSQSGIMLPEPNLQDYLGRGFSGEIYGKRARVSKISWASFRFENPLAAFPDTVSVKHIIRVKDRKGSIGGEILRRFSVVMDYSSQRMFIRPNRFLDEPFHYNMSGLEVHHHGMDWIRETVALKGLGNASSYDINGDKIPSSFIYKFELKPVYAVTNVRPGSPAQEAGLLQGDIIVSINRKPGYRYTLQEIHDLFKQGDKTPVTIAVQREGKIIEFSFRLRRML
jgi:hypothetical protein